MISAMDGTLKQLNHLFSLAHELVGGVFFLHWGIVTSILLYNAALLGCLGNAMLPLVRHAKLITSPPALDVR